MGRTKDFADVIRAKLAANPDLAEQVENELFNADLASKVYAARKAAGLTQKQLADKAQTQQSVISRIEDADYDGRSLTLLGRIAKALNLELRVEFCERCLARGSRTSQTFSIEWPETHWQKAFLWPEYEIVLNEATPQDWTTGYFTTKRTFATEGINWITEHSLLSEHNLLTVR